jgi:hypothetical protein
LNRRTVGVVAFLVDAGARAARSLTGLAGSSDVREALAAGKAEDEDAII